MNDQIPLANDTLNKRLNDERFAFVMPYHISQKGGGAEVQTWEIARELAARGIETTYICQSLEPEKVGSRETVQGVEIRWLTGPSRVSWLDHAKYMAALNCLHPSIVVQRLSSDVSYPIARYCRKNGAYFVWMCPDNRAPLRWMRLHRTLESSTFTKSPFKLAATILDSIAIDCYRQGGISRVGVAFTQSKMQEKLLAENFDLESCRSYSGHQLSQKDYGPDDRFKKRTFLWAGNLGENKRPDLFYRLAQSMEDTNAMFVMMGAPKYESQTQKFARTSNFRFLGHVKQEECLKLFDEGTVLVNTSISEGFPNTFVQGWIRGLPSLSLGVDPDGVVQENKLGVVVEDEFNLRREARNLISNIDYYALFSESAKDYAIRHHTIQSSVNSFLCGIADNLVDQKC